MIIPIIAAILGLNLLILVHELGHFIVGKRKGIRVETFSIGFGPKIIGFKRGETEYKLSLILVGGYVKFFGDEVEESKDPRSVPGGFFTTSPWTRILVCLAGGFANILLAFLLYTVIFYQGKPVMEDSLSTIIGWVQPGSVAEKIGLLSGDKILSINGRPVTTWEELVQKIAFSKRGEVIIEAEHNGKVFKKEGLLQPDPETGIRRLGIANKETIIIGGFEREDSPAEKAGLLKGDEIININRKKIFRFEQLIEIINENEGKRITLTVLRDGTKLKIDVIPEKLKDKKYADIGLMYTTLFTVIHPTPWKQFWHDFSLAGRTLQGLLTRRVPVKAMMGPVGIVGIIGIIAQVGWIPLLTILALISLNLGLINLLPIPVLDGGHIMFTIIEAIRKKPLNLKTIAKIQNVFMMLLITLILYVTYNDVLRLFFKG